MLRHDCPEDAQPIQGQWRNRLFEKVVKVIVRMPQNESDELGFKAPKVKYRDSITVAILS